MGKGTSKSGKKKPYGTEFETILQIGNVKYVRPISGATTAPMYTKSERRIYATIDKEGQVRFITFYDATEEEEKKRYKQIDIRGEAHEVDGELILPHVHYGYLHYENGTFKPTEVDKKFIEIILKGWYDFNNRE